MESALIFENSAECFMFSCKPCQVDAGADTLVASPPGGGGGGDDPMDAEKIKRALQQAA